MGAARSKSQPSRQKPPVIQSVKSSRRRKLLWSGLVLVLITVAIGVYFFNVKDTLPSQNEQQGGGETAEQPVILNDEDLVPETWVEREKQRITGTDDTALQQRIDAANYYANTYEYEKVLKELELIQQEFSQAEENLDFLVSMFVAHQQLNNAEKVKEYAVKIKNLETQTSTKADDIPPNLRKSIDEAAE